MDLWKGAVVDLREREREACKKWNMNSTHERTAHMNRRDGGAGSERLVVDDGDEHGPGDGGLGKVTGDKVHGVEPVRAHQGTGELGFGFGIQQII